MADNTTPSDSSAAGQELPPLDDSQARAWIIPGDDGTAHESGFMDAMWHERGEFSKPLFDTNYVHAYARAALAQRDAAAVPVAWRYHWSGRDGKWNAWHVVQTEPAEHFKAEPLYTHPSPQGDKP
jgi:hypothetical protein